MKYKVIATIIDGVIAANKNNIVCFAENTLDDENGNSLFDSDGIYIGKILTEKNHKNADLYWSYSSKEWDMMNKEFAVVRLETEAERKK